MHLFIFNYKFMLVPFAKRNVVTYQRGGITGYSEYYIFGIRIAKIQQTTPW